MRLDFHPDRPIYQQIIEEFQRAVARGELAPGERIPSQREFAQEARVNPNTVQRAYREMEQMELTETRRGQGSYIREDAELVERLRMQLAEAAVARFIEEMRGLGYDKLKILTSVERGLSVSEDGKEGDE